MPMILRSGRVKTDQPPAVRHRFPVLRPLGEVRFSHTRRGAQYESVEVDVGALLSREFHHVAGILHEADGGDLFPQVNPMWSGDVEGTDALLVDSAVQHGNRALRRFRRGERRSSAAKIVLSRASATVLFEPATTQDAEGITKNVPDATASLRDSSRHRFSANVYDAGSVIILGANEWLTATLVQDVLFEVFTNANGEEQLEPRLSFGSDARAATAYRQNRTLGGPGLQRLRFGIAEFVPMAGSGGTPQLPPRLAAKKAVSVIFPTVPDTECFRDALWLKESGLTTKTGPARTCRSVRAWGADQSTLDFSMIKFPMSLDQLPVFEAANKITIAVYSWEEGKVIPLRIPRGFATQEPIPLLLHDEHFSLIKNFDRLCSAKGKQRYHCPRCLLGYRDPKAREKHMEQCSSCDAPAQAIEMPKPGTRQEFKIGIAQTRAPVAVYADFESVLVPHGLRALRDMLWWLRFNEPDLYKTSALEEAFSRLGTIRPAKECDQALEYANKQAESPPFNAMGPSELPKLRALAVRKDSHKAASWRTHVALSDPSIAWTGPLDTEYVGEDAAERFVDHMVELHEAFELTLKANFDIDGPAPAQDRCYLCDADFAKAPKTATEYRARERKPGESLMDYVKRQKWYAGKSKSENENAKFFIEYCKAHEAVRGWRNCADDWFEYVLPVLEEGACRGLRPVRDHCHLQECNNIRGWACSRCNVKVRDASEQRKLPLIFHNGAGYDWKLIIKDGGLERYPQIPIDALANNSESLKSWSFGRVRMVDSFAHTMCGLDGLLKSMNDDQKPRLREYAGDDWDLLSRKGIFPYEHFDSLERLDQPIPLDNPDAWYSSLSGGVSQDELLRARQICERRGITTLRQWHDLYLRIDVLGLADALETHRTICMDAYGLDPLHYIGAPGLFWDALLKTTGATPELISDVDMYAFFEKGLRGGICQVSQRYANAEEPAQDEEGNELEHHIKYVDATNLYGHAMIQKMPYSGFAWVEGSPDELTDMWHRGEMFEGAIGATLEVDLHIPEELHDKLARLPPAPSKRTVRAEELSDYARKHSGGTVSKCTRLVADLHDKEHYVVHHRALRNYEKMGCIVTKVHRAVRYREKAWMRPYILANAERRKGKTGHEKAFWKLANNSVFGKTMESVRGRTAIRFSRDEEHFERQVSRPTWRGVHGASKLGATDIDGDSSGVVMTYHESPTVKLNKPIYTGQCILDVSKQHMYEFYQTVQQRTIGWDLCYMDTDSFIFDIKTKSLAADYEALADCLDMSMLPEGDPLRTTHNKGVLGKFTDETEGKAIKELVATTQKSYSLKMYDDSEKRACKGVTKRAAAESCKHENFLNTLHTGQAQHATVAGIRSTNYQLHTTVSRKVAITVKDTKRHLLDDGINSLPYGHKDLKRQRTDPC